MRRARSMGATIAVSFLAAIGRTLSAESDEGRGAKILLHSGCFPQGAAATFSGGRKAWPQHNASMVDRTVPVALTADRLEDAQPRGKSHFCGSFDATIRP